MNRTAIIVVAYNRVDSLRRLLTSLEAAHYTEPTSLIISIDKSKTDSVEIFADAYKWRFGEKKVVKHSENLGLRNHMLSLGVHFVDYDAIIVLEDDVTVSPSFMLYVNAAIEKYSDDDRIAGISLYNFNVNYQTELPFCAVKSNDDVYLMQCAMSWGEVWLKKQWQEFEHWYDNQNDEFDSTNLPEEICNWPKSSWLKYHTRYCIEQNKFFIYPYLSLTTNNADAGVNFEHNDTLYQSNMQVFSKKEYNMPAFENIKVSYDGFFEPMFLAEHLGLNANELTVDLNCEKNSKTFKRYILTTKALPYKIVKSFAMELRPIEANIIFGREGNDIWLYDSTLSALAPEANDTYQIHYYLYGKAFLKALFMMGVKRIIKILADLVRYKINKTLNHK